MPIEHIVVLMLENRSFDNVLGALYGTDGPPYPTAPTGQAGMDGIPRGASNPGPDGPVSAHNQTAPTSVATGPTYAPTTIPIVDPGEYFSDMAQQIIGRTTLPTSPPWNGYSPTGPSSAQGYVLNYAALDGFGQAKPPAENVQDVMNCFTPAQFPVTAFLASSYGLSDQWFSSVPSQTYVNRAFALSAAPSVPVSFGATGPYSFIEDLQYFDPAYSQNPQRIPIQNLPTILSQLDEALSAAGASGPFWKVYFHDYSITYDTLQYVRETVAAGTGLNVGTFDGSDWGTGTPTQLTGPTATSFVQDLRNQNLPRFSWIEPRYFDDWAPSALPPNSNHPGNATKPPINPGTKAPIDAATGEVLLMELYNLLRASPLWESTLFIVTYDEPGGLWDHVAPQYASPPGGTIPPASFLPIPTIPPLPPIPGDPAAAGFTYNVFGGRVPTLVVSPMVPRGSLFRAPTAGLPFDHTSIIKTVRDAFLAPLGATAPLTGRDAVAPSVLPGLTASPVNDTGFFQGTIVAGPASLYFMTLQSGADVQTVFASAGPGYPLAASVSQPEGESWLSVSATGPTGTFAVTANPDGVPKILGIPKTGKYFGQIEFFTTGATAASNTPLVVPVRLDVTA